MKGFLRKDFLPVFFGLSACSWMPHWACHYYRLETHTSFVVGSWNFSPTDSAMSLVVYSVFILLNLVCIGVVTLRFRVSLITGIGHILIGLIHVYRFWRPFPFEVFGAPWSLGASLREAIMVLSFGALCLFVASRLYAKRLA